MNRKERDKKAGYGTFDPNGVNRIKNEVVRDVARAIMNEVTPECDLEPEEMAIAAIEAMREPTVEMLRVGGGNARETWERMIDAALQESRTK